MKRLTRTRKLFGFLRELRHELFDDAFQSELESMYRRSGAGRPPHPPALLAMATLLQAYHGISDAEAVELSVVDLRWQMVLDRLGATEPAFSQGALSDFREVVCRPWVPHRNDLFTKRDFTINMRARTITCPAGKIEQFKIGTVVEFEPRKCARCAIRFLCTTAKPGSGRTVNIAENEQLQHRLRKFTASPAGRARLRERIVIEHRLAHISQKQGRRARYRGLRKNLFDLRRAASVLNMETIHRRQLADAA